METRSSNKRTRLPSQINPWTQEDRHDGSGAAGRQVVAESKISDMANSQTRFVLKQISTYPVLLVQPSSPYRLSSS